MRILLLCDRKSAQDDVQMLAALQGLLESFGHEVQVLVMSNDELKPCIGCYSCWLKTPGMCAITQDEANSIASKAMNADALVLLTEIVFGGFSADIKAYLDRSIQNILPRFEMYQGEMHHPKRYERFPIWVALGYGEVNDAEKQTFVHLADRNALNMRPERYVALTVENRDDLKGKAAELCRILEVSA